MAKRHLAILRLAEEVTGHVALTCRYDGISRAGVLHLAPAWAVRAGKERVLLVACQSVWATQSPSRWPASRTRNTVAVIVCLGGLACAVGPTRERRSGSDASVRVDQDRITQITMDDY